MRRKLIYLFCLILALGLVLTKSAEGTDPCLVGWWKFDENSGHTAADSSGNENHGTLSTTNTKWTEDGRINGALNFTGGDNYVVVPDSPTLNPTEEISITVWLKPTWTGNGRILQKGSGDNQYRLLREFGDNFVFHLAGLSNDKPENIPCPSEGEWTHVAATYDGAAMKVYYNSKLVGEVATRGAINTSIGPLYIGTKYSGSHAGDEYRGIMDEVRLYSRALTETEVAVIYEGGTIDERIARNPDKVLREAYEDLQHFGNWRTNPKVKKEYAAEISEMLLIIGKAKEAKGTPSEEALKEYYKLTTQFPSSPYAIEALCGIVILDEQNGLEYAMNFLEKSGTANRIISFYTVLIRSLMVRSDYAKVDKYVKLFIDKYTSSEKGLKIMAQIMSSLGQVPKRKELYDIIERRVTQDPNSVIRCALFRQRALALSRDRNFGLFLEKAESVRRKFPGTRLDTCASAVLADNQYQQGNFVSAIEAFKPGLFTDDCSEPAMIEDISNIVVLYNVNTLRIQGIDLGKVYETLAKYCCSLNRNAVAAHCYRQSAKAKGFSLDAFESAASKIANYCNTTPENEIWFWKGLFAAEEGDLMAAGLMYEGFLKKDATSILAARAYYDTARARMVLGQYSEAREAIAEAKRISPCESVIQLEWEIADPALSLRGRTNTKM
ncbi:MAG: hypothetical protein FVQ84_04430 [Planctomycetes bacterium]|nr:hypothetical protein [Planctomycetota bacterium]